MITKDTLRSNLSKSEEYVLAKVRHVQQAPEMRRNFDAFFILSMDILKKNFKTQYILDYPIETITAITTTAFDKLMKSEPKQYDYTIYALATLGASFAVDRIHADNNKHEFVLPPFISLNERGEIEGMKALYKKYGLPRNERIENWNF